MLKKNRKIRLGLCFLILVVGSMSVSADDEIIMPPGYIWEYTSSDPTANPDWTITIDDGEWETGPAPFGNATGAGVNGETIFNYNTYWPEDISGKGDDFWVRTAIDLTGYDLSTIKWDLGVDNDYTLYINGDPAIETRSGWVPYTYRWEYSGYFPETSLRSGFNIIAVALNDWGGATAFDMQVTGTIGGAGDDNEGPQTTSLAFFDSVEYSTIFPSNYYNIALDAIVDDTKTGGSDIVSAEYSLDEGTWTSMEPFFTKFDSPKERVFADLKPSLPVGVHKISVRATDSSGNTTDPIGGWPGTQMIAVYDSDRPFVAGAGMINAQAGDFKDDLSFSGQVLFGFVFDWDPSVKKPVEPEGSTEFVFQLEGLDFHSDSCDTVRVYTQGTRESSKPSSRDVVYFEGTGLVNGIPGFKFEIVATDKHYTALHLKIKIWEDGKHKHVVYNNGDRSSIGSRILNGMFVIGCRHSTAHGGWCNRCHY